MTSIGERSRKFAVPDRDDLEIADHLLVALAVDVLNPVDHGFARRPWRDLGFDSRVNHFVEVSDQSSSQIKLTRIFANGGRVR